MTRFDVIVVGAGPGGLSAAIEAAKRGMRVAVFDENERPGGQLVKQIHKFFGSRKHRAKIRGYNIGRDLLKEAREQGVKVHLNATVSGLYLDREVTVQMDGEVRHFKGDAIIIATGASENMVPFPGWTLPGVIGAGAAQTMMNLHGIRPGSQVFMLGSGNVGLVVSYQLLQAGCQVVALADAAPQVGGYGVHAAKITRCGVPIYTSHTIKKVHGETCVEGVTIGEVGSDFQIIGGAEKTFEVDTVCLAVGLTPMGQLLKMLGCEMKNDPAKGGQVPVCDAWGATSIPGVFVAGDVSGIDEASSAMISGRIAGIAAAKYLGFLENKEFQRQAEELQGSLASLHQGMFAPGRKGKPIAYTDEGCPISQSLLTHGCLSPEEVTQYPGVTSRRGVHPVIECTQNIPCNPCQDACARGCIRVNGCITSLPAADLAGECTGCGMCVAVCPGQAIFLVDEAEDSATVTIPYEFLPLPEAGTKGIALDRSGKDLCSTKVLQVKAPKGFDKTALVTMEVPRSMGMLARFIKFGEAQSR